jgi:hypothetical protein
MSERLYLFILGASILVALYMAYTQMVYGLSLVLVLEGVSGIRMTTMIQRLRDISLDHDMALTRMPPRFGVDGLSAWRVFVAFVLVASDALVYQDGYELLWFTPWFMGFAIMGAGATGICPVLHGLHRIGFK